MKTNSIKFKFISTIILTTTIALLVSSAAMVVYNLRNYNASTSEELTAQAALLSQAVTPALLFDDPASARTYLQLLQNQEAVLAAAIYNEKGILFAGYNIEADGSHNVPTILDSDGIRVFQDSIVIYKRIVANNEIIGFAFVRMQYAFYGKLWVNIAISLAGILLALVIALMVSLRLQKTVTGPLHSIAHLARKLVESKDYSLRAQRNFDGEVAYLVEAFNEMLDEMEFRKRALEIANKELGDQVQEKEKAESALRLSEENIRKLNADLEKRVRFRTQQLENTNLELEAFSYSVSHDLRTPLRAIDGFSQALLEDYENVLDDEGKDYLQRVRRASQRMGELIDDILKLSRVNRVDMSYQEVDLSKLVEQLLGELRDTEPERKVEVVVTSQLAATCDPHLIKIALANLLNNAWKYTSKSERTKIEFGMRLYDGEPVFFVQDNGVGFDMTYADKLFGAFQRLHTESEFSGSGIGLATTKRVISRHAGKIWAESSVGAGATFYFTLPAPEKLEILNEGENDHDYPTDLAC